MENKRGGWQDSLSSDTKTAEGEGPEQLPPTLPSLVL